MAYKNNKNGQKQYYKYMDRYSKNGGEDSFGMMLAKKGKGKPACLPQENYMKNVSSTSGSGSMGKYPSSMSAQNQQISADKKAMMRSASGKKSKY